MSKFKVGDKVRAIFTDPEDLYNVGDVGEVKRINDFGVYYIDFILENCLAVEEQLEPVSTNTQNWWETPEGVEWLSEQQDVEEQFLKSQEKKEEKTYKVGQRFLVVHKGIEWNCILAQVGLTEVCLISLESGNRINDPVTILDSRKITEDEMELIAGACTFHLL